MRKGNMTILASILAISLVSIVFGAATLAYFNEVEQAAGNTFTAGHLDIKLYDGSNWVDGVTGFWSTPDNWAPGETYTKRLYFKNLGNVPVQVVLLDFKKYVSTVGPSSFWDVIEVVSFYEFVEGDTINYAPYIAGWYGDEEEPLTLHELIDTPNGVQGHLDNCDVILFDDHTGYHGCGAPNDCLLGGTYLGPGEQGWLELGFKFSSTAGTAYENAECSFDLQMSFIQGPDSGICRCEMPRYVSP